MFTSRNWIVVHVLFILAMTNRACSSARATEVLDTQQTSTVVSVLRNVENITDRAQGYVYNQALHLPHSDMVVNMDIVQELKVTGTFNFIIYLAVT